MDGGAGAGRVNRCVQYSTLVSEGRAPKKCKMITHGSPTKLRLSRRTIGIVKKAHRRSELSSGRRPLSKSNEFKKTIPLIIEIYGHPKSDYLPKHVTPFGQPDPGPTRERDPRFEVRCAFLSQYTDNLDDWRIWYSVYGRVFSVTV